MTYKRFVKHVVKTSMELESSSHKRGAEINMLRIKPIWAPAPSLKFGLSILAAESKREMR